jgi:hypothetical protein
MASMMISNFNEREEGESDFASMQQHFLAVTAS